MNLPGFLHDLMGLTDTFGDVWHGDIDALMLKHGLLEQRGDVAVPSKAFLEYVGNPEDLADWETSLPSTDDAA